MTRAIINATTSKARRPSWVVVALAILSMVAVACAGTDPSADEPTGTPASTLPPATTESTVGEVASTTATDSTVPTTTAAVTRSTPPITLGEDDRIFYAGIDTVVVAHAPDPWEPFPVSSLGMRRDLGTAEWVGISFWDPREVATNSCRWIDSWENPGESVAEFAEALVAIPGRQATSPVPVTVGGYDGLYLEWSLPADLDITTCDEEKTVAWTGPVLMTRSHSTPGQIDRIWILDVEGQRILIDVISLPVEQETIRERVDEVIDSLRFAVNGWWLPVPGPVRDGSPARYSGELYDAAGRALWIGTSGSAYWFSPETETWVPDPDVVRPNRPGLPAAVGDRVVIAGATELSISSPEGTSRIPAPWTADVAFVEGVGDTFVAYVGTFENTEWWFEFYTERELILEQIWTSTDGVEWAGPLVPEFIDGPTSALFVNNNGVSTILTRQGLWTTRDWRVWTDTGVVPYLSDGDAITFGNGALLVNGDRAWFSPDMESWHEVPLDGFALGERRCRGRMYAMAVDDLAYIVTTVNLDTEPGDCSFTYPAGYDTDVRIIRQP
jgi:hypothetical protein